MKRKKQFEYMSNVIYSLFVQFKRPEIYEKLWNPLNYAIVGGIGVVINFVIMALLISVFPWWAANAVAILTAWTWNWANSVGPMGYLWGFKEKK